MTDIPNHCHEHGCSFLVMCAKTSLCVCYLHIGRPFLLCSTQHINYVLFMFNLFIIKLKSTQQSSLFFFAVVLGLLMWVLTTACTLWSSRFRSVPFPGPYTLTQVTKFLRLLELIVCFLASFPSNEKTKTTWFPAVTKLFTKVNDILFCSMQHTCLLWYRENELWNYIAMFYLNLVSVVSCRHKDAIYLW